MSYIVLTKPFLITDWATDLFVGVAVVYKVFVVNFAVA